MFLPSLIHLYHVFLSWTIPYLFLFSNLYLFNCYVFIPGHVDPTNPYTRMGCWADTSQRRAIPTLEGSDPILDNHYLHRKQARLKCLIAASKRGFTVFALQAGGWCASSATAQSTYKRYGTSSGCLPDGKGGSFANHVYKINGKHSLSLSILFYYSHLILTFRFFYFNLVNSIFVHFIK